MAVSLDELEEANGEFSKGGELAPQEACGGPAGVVLAHFPVQQPHDGPVGEVQVLPRPQTLPV